MGRNLHIEKKLVTKEFNIALNGDKSCMIIYRNNGFSEKYPNLYFVDQREYVLPLYDR